PLGALLPRHRPGPLGPHGEGAHGARGAVGRAVRPAHAGLLLRPHHRQALISRIRPRKKRRRTLGAAPLPTDRVPPLLLIGRSCCLSVLVSLCLIASRRRKKGPATPRRRSASTTRHLRTRSGARE